MRFVNSLFLFIFIAQQKKSKKIFSNIIFKYCIIDDYCEKNQYKYSWKWTHGFKKRAQNSFHEIENF